MSVGSAPTAGRGEVTGDREEVTKSASFCCFIQLVDVTICMLLLMHHLAGIPEILLQAAACRIHADAVGGMARRAGCWYDARRAGRPVVAVARTHHVTEFHRGGFTAQVEDGGEQEMSGTSLKKGE